MAAQRKYDLLKAAEAHLPDGVVEAVLRDLEERLGRAATGGLASAEARLENKKKQLANQTGVVGAGTHGGKGGF